ncbi:hypothetical protein Metfor_1667 [Methanoregula formicica SMSP]|uniref:DUF3821 domain-containing protein n=2 Tax=Methanoregula formicica TaxID=882104 RepID=L0HFC9_METFS|nr:hypothetical protein Metfor_1667 [Methanoregula formicica SMSP]
MNIPVIPGRSFMRCSLTLILFVLLSMPATAVTLTPGASSGSTTISNGDPVYINGVATGHPQNGLQIWLIGNNMVRITTVQVNSDNTYTYEITSTETQNFAPGQYLVIVQHPMMNGQYDITYSAATGQVINRQMQASGGSGSGTAIFQLTRAGNLQSSDAASALMRAIGSQNVDDTFATVSFFINPPNAFVNPVGDHVVGEKFMISGTTNLAVGDKLQVDVYSSSFSPTKKSQSGAYSGASGVVEVTAGTGGKNQWSFAIDSATFRPDEYIITVEGILQDVKGSATFNILAATPAPTTTVQLPMTPLPETKTAFAIATTPTVRTVEPVTTHADVPVWVIFSGLVAAILLQISRRR